MSDGKEALDDATVVLGFKYQVLEKETTTYTLGIIIPFVDTFSSEFGMSSCNIVQEFEARHLVREVSVKIVCDEILERFRHFRILSSY